VKNILIVRLSAIGDVVMASPLPRSLKLTYPEARVTWLVEEGSREILAGNPYIDEIIVWPRAEWKKLQAKGQYGLVLNQFTSLVRQLRTPPRFDLALDIQGLFKSGLWTFLSGARHRVGLGSKEGSRILMDRVIERSGPSDRISSQYLLLAEKLGLKTDGFPMMMPILPDDERFAEGFISRNSLSRGYIAFCPFTTRPQKHWFENRWAELAVGFRDHFGLPAVVLGGPGDVEASKRIQDLSGDTMLSLVGKTTIKQAAAIIGHSFLAVGVDTGLTHIGYALGVPTVALFGATRPYLHTDTMPGVVLYYPHECSPCRRSPTCDGLFPCMEAITVDEVMEVASKMMRKEQVSK
jgi:heptosyltransferase-1